MINNLMNSIEFCKCVEPKKRTVLPYVYSEDAKKMKNQFLIMVKPECLAIEKGVNSKAILTHFRERAEMKTTKSNVKRTLLVGTLILSLSGMVGCVSTHKQQEIENNKKIVELQPNELSFEETRALKPGDIVPKGKEINRELLEQQGMDYIYIYPLNILQFY